MDNRKNKTFKATFIYRCNQNRNFVSQLNAF